MLARGAKTLVIGFGNSMRRDDGVGPAVAGWLEKMTAENPRVNVIETYQLTPELAERVSQVGQVVFVDASVALERGQVEVRRAHGKANVGAGVGHRVSPEMILLLAEAMYGRRPVAWVIEIGVGSLAIGEYLTLEVESAGREVAYWLASELASS